MDLVDQRPRPLLYRQYLLNGKREEGREKTGSVNRESFGACVIPTCAPSGNREVGKVRHGTEAFRNVSQIDEAVAQGLFDLIKRFEGSIGHGVLT